MLAGYDYVLMLKSRNMHDITTENLGEFITKRYVYVYRHKNLHFKRNFLVGGGGLADPF